jgi:hypothetical protein
MFRKIYKSEQCAPIGYRGDFDVYTPGKYRINTATLVLVLDGDRHRGGHTVPKGAVVVVDRTTFGMNNLVQITWDGKKAMMFLQDLRSRGERIDERMSA